MYYDRLEKIFSRDCICSSGAFYDVCQTYNNKERDNIYYTYLDNFKVKIRKGYRTYMPFEIMKFEKPSDIDKLIYQMCVKCSNISFGKIKTMDNDGDILFNESGFVFEKHISDIFRNIGDDIEGYILCGEDADYYSLLRKLKPKFCDDGLCAFLKNRIIFSQAIPFNTFVFTGTPMDVGIMNGPRDVDQWMYRNFFMVPGHVFVFRMK